MAATPPSSRSLGAYWLVIAAVHGLLASLFQSRAGYKLLAELGYITRISLREANGLAVYFVLVVAFALLMLWVFTSSNQSPE